MGLVLISSVLSQSLRAQPELVAPTDALSPAEERAKLKVPPGFEIQLVASEPFIWKPMNLGFDDRGRLWVTSSREYPFPADDTAEARDRITILSDFAPDGRALTITQFAEGLNIPIGLLPLSDHEAIVHSIPQVLKLTDTDGDGKADEREVILEEFGSRDTHGMTNAFTVGFDGWIYACHGFSNTSTVEADTGDPITMQSGNTYRFRSDGSEVEQWTWGQVNPFGLSLDPMGNLWSSDCHTMPIYQLLRGAYYPSFGKPHDGLGFGPPMMDHNHGSTGIAGIVAYHGDHFPESYRGTIFVGNPVTARVNHDRIEWTGSTPRAIEQPDFVVSEDPWFRPVDIELGPDGALYIADFYNKIIGHYEVPLTHPGRDRARGRIWRIVYVGEDGSAPSPEIPREDWGRATLDELIEDLSNANFMVRMQAMEELIERPTASGVDQALLEELSKTDQPPDSKVHLLWALERRLGLNVEQVSAGANDPAPVVRRHTIAILGERRDWSEHDRSTVLEGLQDSNPFVRRASAEALGIHPAPEQLRPLLIARDVDHRDKTNDSHLTHTIRIALRNHLRLEEAWLALPDPSELPSSFAEELLVAYLADVAMGVRTLEASHFLMEAIRSRAELTNTPRTLIATLGSDGIRFEIGGNFQVRLNDRDPIEPLVEHSTHYGDGSTETSFRNYGEKLLELEDRSPNVEVMQILRGLKRGLDARGALPSNETLQWASKVAQDQFEAAQISEAIELTRLYRLDSSIKLLQELVEEPTHQEAIKSAAIVALGDLEPSLTLSLLADFLNDPEQSNGVRTESATSLGRQNTPEALQALQEAITIAPAALQSGIALALSGSRNGAESLLELIAQGKVSPRILLEGQLRTRLQSVGLDDLEGRIEKLTNGLPSIDETRAALIEARLARFAQDEPDLDVGKLVFQKNCASCHQLSGEGARVGPQLDGVGNRGPARLMEDILDPNRNVDQAFRATTLALLDGRVLTGLLLEAEGELISLIDNEGKEVRIPIDEVDERQVTKISGMPADFESRIDPESFNSLIAYLLQQRLQEQQ